MNYECPSNKKYFPAILLGLALILFLNTPARADDFIDTSDNWARIELSQLKATGILQGYPDGSFKPDQPVSRAEFTKLLVAALGKKNDAQQLGNYSPAFADIPYGYWGNGYILAGREMGWLQGQGAGFSPDASITRQEAALILSRIAASAVTEPNELNFSDVQDIADWAQAGVQQAVQQELVKGFSDGTFRPQGQLTRAEAVHLLQAIMDKQGCLYDFVGYVQQAEGQEVSIQVAGHGYTFDLARKAQIFDRGRLASLDDLIGVCVNFNINREGDIIFVQTSYEEKYVSLSVKQQTMPTTQAISITGQLDSPPEGELSAQDVLLPASDDPPSKTQPSLSMDVSRQISGITKLNAEQGLSGAGSRIAIIDSGIDPIQQDLQLTADGRRKVIDWANFSNEGRVRTNLLATAQPNDCQIKTTYGMVILPESGISCSGQYHYGYWQEDWITYLNDFDFNGNNTTNDQILVLVTDSRTPGVYDQVYVDTNHNFSLADEVPLRIYRANKYNYASFPATVDLPQGFSFVLCDIGDGGNSVSFGYDSQGHGTHVAGILAANGKIHGVAPNAQLMILKVADNAGIADMESTLQAVEYAVSKGANIINISLGYDKQDVQAYQKFRERIDELAANTLICVAAGNDGPGFSTLVVPADAPHILSVGAYIEPKMWSTDYGWTTELTGLWYFSAVGPTMDGGMKPDLLAPGSAVSAAPVWTGESYKLMEGSSMAVPFVSGSAALLMEEMWKQGYGFNSLMIKQALVSGARKIGNLLLTEQGHGVLDAYESARIVIQEKALPDDSGVQLLSNLSGEGSGLVIRESIPGRASFSIQNQDHEAILKWQSKAEWMQLENDPVYLPAGGQRNLQVKYELPDKPGLYAGLLEATFVDSNRIPLEILNTIIIPEQWSENGEINKNNNLAAGQMQRIFIQVPEGEKMLQLKIRVPGSLKNLQGRVRMHIFDGAGNLYKVTEFAGMAPAGLTATQEVSVIIDLPIMGIWEVVVYCSSTLSQYGLSGSDYSFSAKLDHPAEKPDYTETEFIIGAAIPLTTAGQTNIGLTILNVSNKLPYDGLLQINDRLYYVNKGKVLITSDIRNKSLNLTIKRVN